ncbi:MAG TPA: hypothetical protein VMV20_08085 [Chitinophagaceae bacterium]|nr:hypothetical protein [Chitinophagaceae bacterium]
MLHLHDLKVGDLVRAEFEQKEYEGTVEQISFEKVEVLHESNDQLNWYDPKDLDPVPLTEDKLSFLGFVKSTDPELNGEGQAWVRGPFILTYLKKGDSQHILLNCQSEEPRLIKTGLFVHELQHHYHGMTKVFLEFEP